MSFSFFLLSDNVPLCTPPVFDLPDMKKIKEVYYAVTRLRKDDTKK